MHNRINALEKEEVKAIKKIEDTRRKACNLIQTKMERQNIQSTIDQVRSDKILRAREIVQTTKREEESVKLKKHLVLNRNKIIAEMVKIEGDYFKKVINKNNENHMRQVLDRKYENQYQNDACQRRQEQERVMKAYLKQKKEEQSIDQESKLIKKRVKQGRKLQKIEMAMLERLKDTYSKQQETIEEIQYVFNTKVFEEMAKY